MPLSEMACGEVATLSARLIFSDSGPVTEGVNVALMVQLPVLGASVTPPQVVEAVKPLPVSGASGVAPNIRFAVPVLVTVIVWDALVVLRTCGLNVRVLLGLRLMTGAAPVPK